jgi:nucleoside 2-deoxyribosyltransferase
MPFSAEDAGPPMTTSSSLPDTAPKKFVFVLMPFDAKFRDIYEVGIKPACRDAGAYCERVDEQIFHESILERVYNQISKADLIVADMTGRNANVFYEVGYAHALNKRTLLTYLLIYSPIRILYTKEA